MKQNSLGVFLLLVLLASLTSAQRENHDREDCDPCLCPHLTCCTSSGHCAQHIYDCEVTDDSCPLDFTRCEQSVECTQGQECCYGVCTKPDECLTQMAGLLGLGILVFLICCCIGVVSLLIYCCCAKAAPVPNVQFGHLHEEKPGDKGYSYSLQVGVPVSETELAAS